MEPDAGGDVTSTLSSGWEHREAASTLSFFPPYTGRLKKTSFPLRPGVNKTITNGQAHDKNLVSGVGLRGSQGGSKFVSYFQLILPGGWSLCVCWAGGLPLLFRDVKKDPTLMVC